MKLRWGEREMRT